MKQSSLWLALIAWSASVFAMLGSLYFSEILHFPPCTLCWYQRIALYPLVFLIPVGIIRKDAALPYYVLSIVIPGALVSAYHNLLYYNILPEAAAPCISGVSCTTRFVEYFGFVTIPLLALVTFALIIVCMIALIRQQKKHE